MHRYGMAVLAVLAGVLLIAVNADTARLIPLYAIGVFTGFTISQTGLVRHWHSQRTPRWLLRAALNGTGASKLTEHALQAALSLGDEIIAVSVQLDNWNPGVRLDTLDSPHRSLVRPIVGYVRRAQQPGRQVVVMITEVQPRRWRYRILQNQRGLLLATVLRASTDAVICTIPYRLTSR